MWNLDYALLVIRMLQPIAFVNGFNLHLGGGVLNNGKSDSDLDIIALPRFQIEPNRTAFLAECANLGWTKIDEYELPRRELVLLTRNKAVIEMIFFL